MKINLIPISHPELKKIEIDSAVFTIGRVEKPFLSYDTEVTADISRHHAKIFTEKGQIFIADLESLNGTVVNGIALTSTPLAIKNGDIIEFARHLSYKIELSTSDPDATQFADHQQKNSLTLEPIDNTSGINILSITGFPFLISKEAGVFTSFKTNFPNETNRISRRHAYIVLENREVKLIDMSSTNGTYINKKRLGEDQPTSLKNGDIISFAGDFFTYIVKLDLADQPKIEETIVRSSNSSGNEDTNFFSDKSEPKTTFVNEATPFLDIFCEEGKQFHPSENKVEKNNNNFETKNSNRKKISFFTSFIQQCRDALTDEKPKKSKKKIYLISLALICIVGTTAYFYLNDKTQKIKNLINLGQYSKAASLSKELLKSDSTNATLKELSTTANLNQIVSSWQEQLKQSQYSNAEQILIDFKNLYIDNSDISKSLILLQWVSDVRQYSSNHSDSERIEIFKDENEIQTLLSYWNNNQQENRKTLAIIARKVTSFAPYYEQVLSDIRLLENDQNLYLKAIDTLNKSLKEQLDTGKSQNLHTTVTTFENKYTAITGLDDLKLDIYHYIELNDAVIKKDIEHISTLQKQYSFKTPPFIKHNKQIFAQQIPSLPFVGQYYEALTAWKKGDTTMAISQLQSLSESEWGSFAEKKLSQYHSIKTKFSELNNSEGSDKYIENLFNFHALLKRPEDNYFLSLIEQDFQDNEKLAINKANTNYTQAKALWNEYENNNGIGGILRLEKEVSLTFKTQAKRLATAFQNIIYSQQIYKNLHIEMPTEIKNLFLEVKNETEKQRKWLIDLELVMKPEALKKKLDLLPTSEEL